MATRADILNLVKTLREQADVIEACGDSQEFEESVADIQTAIKNAS